MKICVCCLTYSHQKMQGVFIFYARFARDANALPEIIYIVMPITFIIHRNA